MKSFCLGSILLATLFAAPSCRVAETKTGMKMDVKTIELPFQLKAEDLLKVEFNCEYRSSQKNPWTESIRISGATGVTLIRHPVPSEVPDSLHGKHDLQAFITLLKLFEDEGFFEMEVEEDPDNKDPIRFIALTIPGQSNRVAIGGQHHIPLVKLLGALRLTAGFSIPKALGKGFLERL
jgi:hypothetical protein